MVEYNGVSSCATAEVLCYPYARTESPCNQPGALSRPQKANMATLSNTETKKIIAYAMATTPSPSDEEIIAWVCDNPITFTKAFGGRGIIGNVLNTKNAIIELLTEKADMIKNLKHEVSVCDEDEDGDGWIVNTSGHISIHLNGATSRAGADASAAMANDGPAWSMSWPRSRLWLRPRATWCSSEVDILLSADRNARDTSWPRLRMREMEVWDKC
ncbi:hypothetical protein HBH98_250070 [Parastagonospora nodorum]|nr:hypothetical protein HBH53_252170 [Parastagonospora nodorum]KAH3956305.1 hypothetical protein HBH51_245340 [Parastagonospora nodorum]KAH4215516.1 hypothetical protein HBI06_248430 [Parastagonospora nodorum]KAH4223590.1 hypothetical protein HBI05_246440 [Parastagonospora nodorum]KAH4333455.1 hypothetical protein HBH98_250070 [Parastagonospora nodorum]